MSVNILKYAQCKCRYCNKWFLKEYVEIRRSIWHGLDKLYCSRTCSAKATYKNNPGALVPKNKEQVGEKNHHWKGGTTKVYRKNGHYVMLKSPNHPRGKHNGGYVFEHILVMEQKLGRYLLPEEHIHHKNLVKNDNRIENLELWTTSHPSGARVEDLIEWAKELLKKYC